ncbi:MAG TPA: S-layer homology domain-containing protein [Clostridiaceae bacterium]|nr:S-layer homology domain-containing protein [Clostridiaceae bacterium]
MMKTCMRLLAFILLAAVLLTPVTAYAVEGSMGYEGGISVEDPIEKGTYSYSEMIFITGRPVLLTGELTIKKTDKNDVVTSTYTYKLQNTENNISMNRVVIYTTTRETKINGQIIETTKLSRVPTEVINVGGTTYRLSSASFTQSMITDPKAAINYHTGEFSEKKVYSVGTGVANQDTVTVTISGRVYAYDQYWSSTETQKLNIMVESDRKSGNAPSKWGGSAEITISSATRRQIDYIENEPYHISFDGGYVQKVWKESTLDYNARFPEFDKNGLPTDYLKTYNDTHSMSTPIELTRLMVPDIKHLNGYWAEEPVSILFGLEIIPGTGENYNTGRFITRREFVAQLINAIKEIPSDPDVRVAATARRTSSKKTPEISPFRDISPGDLYYEQVKIAYQKGITSGNGNGNFGPDLYITRAEAIKMIVSALGLENLAPYPSATTPFTDNDMIPAYARNAVAVANTLGIIEPDQMGAFNPNRRLTNEDAAILIYDLITYMGDELIKDYRDKIMEY